MKQILRSKIHHAVVTKTNVYYEGSMFLDQELMEQSGISPGEKVDISNIRNGERWSTYAAPIERGSRIVSVNGGAARLAQEGDKLIIMAYEITENELTPQIIILDEYNNIKEKKFTL